MIGHAVFDLDGTLVDSVPLFADILNAMLLDRGAPARVTAAQARPHATAGGHAMVTALLGEHCGDVDQAIGEFRERYRALPTPSDSLYPGVAETLAALSAAGVGLAVWSNKPQALCEKVLQELGVADRFGAIVGSGPGVPLKPDPTGYDLALARAGGARARSCFIGDSEADYQAAKRANVPFVMFTYGYGDYSRDWPGAALAAEFAEVTAIVRRWFAPPPTDALTPA